MDCQPAAGLARLARLVYTSQPGRPRSDPPLNMHRRPSVFTLIALMRDSRNCFASAWLLSLALPSADPGPGDSKRLFNFDLQPRALQRNQRLEMTLGPLRYIGEVDESELPKSK